MYQQMFGGNVVCIVPLLLTGKEFVAYFCTAARQIGRVYPLRLVERMRLALEDWEYLSLILEDESFVANLEVSFTKLSLKEHLHSRECLTQSGPMSSSHSSSQLDIENHMRTVHSDPDMTKGTFSNEK